MRSSCAVCFLAVALCLVVSVSADVTVTEVVARKEVTEAVAAVKTVCARAETQFNNATSVLEKVQSAKRDSAQALLQAIEAATGNPKAVEVANTIKSLSDAVDTLYPDAHKNLDTAVKSLTKLLDEAKALAGKADIEIPPNTDPERDSTDVSKKATDLKAEATTLDNNITEALKLIEGVFSTADEMQSKAKEAQLTHYQVSAIVAVGKIETTLGTVDDIIGQIDEKEREVNGIVDEMHKDCTTELTQSNEVIKVQCQIANDALKSAQGAVQNAKDAKTAIQTQKDTANAALTKVLAEKQEVSDAKNEANKAEECVRAAEWIAPKLNSELLKAETSVTNANNAKPKLVEALEKATSQKSTEQSKEKEEKTNLPVVEGTDSQNKNTKIKPTSKDSPDQSDHNAEQLKDALNKDAQNVPTTALTGETAPAPGAKNDSAMTVSVPLLVALIASAVWQ